MFEENGNDLENPGNERLLINQAGGLVAEEDIKEVNQRNDFVGGYHINSIIGETTEQKQNVSHRV